jgi:hypothetical protein
VSPKHHYKALAIPAVDFGSVGRREHLVVREGPVLVLRVLARLHVCVCVCVYDVIYLHICTHMHTHTHATHACIHVHLCVFTRARAHTHMPRDMLSACWNVPEQAPRGHLPRAGRARQHPVLISVVYVWSVVACVGAVHRSVSERVCTTHGRRTPTYALTQMLPAVHVHVPRTKITDRARPNKHAQPCPRILFTHVHVPICIPTHLVLPVRALPCMQHPSGFEPLHAHVKFGQENKISS